MKCPFVGIPRKAKVTLGKAVQAMIFCLRSQSQEFHDLAGDGICFLNDAPAFPASTTISMLPFKEERLSCPEIFYLL